MMVTLDVVLVVETQKAFDTMVHSIFLAKLCHYGIPGLANKWFESYLADGKQFVSISGFALSISNIFCGVL